MRIIFALAILAGSFATTKAIATVENYDRVHLVIMNYQDEEDFFIERAPILACYGLPQGGRLASWTEPYMAPSNVGCGSQGQLEDANALSCATLVDSKEADDFMSFSEITLDISKCPHKNNAKFITMVRTSAKYNFPQTNKKREVKLNLIR